MRTATILICALGALVWLLFSYATLFSGSDPATRGLDVIAGVLMSALFAATIGPSAFLVWKGFAPRAALGLALAYPLILILLVIAAILAF